MARVHYGTSRLYDEYATVVDAYIQEVHGPDYLKTIKNCLDLTAAQRKYKLLTEVLDDISANGFNSMEVIERPTTDLQHGGNIYAAEYTVQNVTETEYTTENQGQEETQETAAA